MCIRDRTHIGGNLIVAAAASMQFLSGFTDALGEDGFNIHMDIFHINGKLNFSGLNIL